MTRTEWRVCSCSSRFSPGALTSRDLWSEGQKDLGRSITPQKNGEEERMEKEEEDMEMLKEEKIEEKEMERRKMEELKKVEETLTEDQKANAVDEDPGLLRWGSVHHHEALIVSRVSHLDVVDDE